MIICTEMRLNECAIHMVVLAFSTFDVKFSATWSKRSKRSDYSKYYWRFDIRVFKILCLHVRTNIPIRLILLVLFWLKIYRS